MTWTLLRRLNFTAFKCTKTITYDQMYYLLTSTTTTTLHPFNGLFSRTTWVSRHQKGKPFWILLEQEMQWHQLDHMQIICTSLHTDNHASTSLLSFLQAGCPSCRPTNSIKALKDTCAYSCIIFNKNKIADHSYSWILWMICTECHDIYQHTTNQNVCK